MIISTDQKEMQFWAEQVGITLPKIGDIIVLRSNSDFNVNVETNKPALLMYGKYSCDEAERETTLRVISDTFLREREVWGNLPDGGYGMRPETHHMCRVISSNTNNVYEVMVDWLDIVDPSKLSETMEKVQAISDMNDLMDEMMNDDPYYDDYPYSDDGF